MSPRIVLVLALQLQLCVAEYSANDCLVGDLRTNDCRFGTFDIETRTALKVDDMVSRFVLNLKHNWTNGLLSTVAAQQRVEATIRNGTLRYFYTKLTDQPEHKTVDAVRVSVKVGSTNVVELEPCDVAADLSDVDSKKWRDCYMLLVSQHYTAVKVYVPDDSVGAKQDCSPCLSNSISIRIKYVMQDAVCSGSGNGTIEGRSYLYYMRDWDVFPSPFVYDFSWPKISSPDRCQLDGTAYPVIDRAAQAVIYSSSDIKELQYFSWEPTVFIGNCYYGAAAADKLASVFLSLFVVSVVICIVMVLLLAWSKYASWQWHGGDFEWDVESVDEESDSGEPREKQSGASVLSWKNRRKLALSSMSVVNWMYSKSGAESDIEHQLNYSASGNMDIGVSSSRKRRPSLDNSAYMAAQTFMPAFSTSVMNPLFVSNEEQQQERIDSFRPSVAPKRKFDPGFDWSLFGSGTMPSGASILTNQCEEAAKVQSVEMAPTKQNPNGTNQAGNPIDNDGEVITHASALYNK
jgi:hypothetical protein